MALVQVLLNFLQVHRLLDYLVVIRNLARINGLSELSGTVVIKQKFEDLLTLLLKSFFFSRFGQFVGLQIPASLS